MSSIPSYFKRDLRTLLILIVIMAGLIFGLWYLEASQGFFSQLAEKTLSF